MSILRGKNILLGISAGIAAYKTAFLVRLFVKAGADVRVVLRREIELLSREAAEAGETRSGTQDEKAQDEAGRRQ